MSKTLQLHTSIPMNHVVQGLGAREASGVDVEYDTHIMCVNLKSHLDMLQSLGMLALSTGVKI